MYVTRQINFLFLPDEVSPDKVSIARKWPDKCRRNQGTALLSTRIKKDNDEDMLLLHARIHDETGLRG